MDIKQKLALEKSGEKVIRLYREGIFYVAYNHSALRFRRLMNNKVKILKHELKKGEWYLRLGVVQTSSMLEGMPVKNENGEYSNYLEIACEESITILEDFSDFVLKKQGTKGVANHGLPIDDYRSDRAKAVITEIRKLNLGTLTPVAAITTIDRWQQMLAD